MPDPHAARDRQRLADLEARVANIERLVLMDVAGGVDDDLVDGAIGAQRRMARAQAIQALREELIRIRGSAV